MEKQKKQFDFKVCLDILLVCFSFVFRTDIIIKICVQTFSQNRHIRLCFSSTALALHQTCNANASLEVCLLQAECLSWPQVQEFMSSNLSRSDGKMDGRLVGWNS